MCSKCRPCVRNQDDAVLNACERLEDVSSIFGFSHAAEQKGERENRRIPSQYFRDDARFVRWQRKILHVPVHVCVLTKDFADRIDHWSLCRVVNDCYFAHNTSPLSQKDL